MTTMTETPRRITGGVDTHRDTHVVAALDDNGAELGVESFPTTPAGYRAALRWLRRFGQVERIGVEGTGSYGAGLTRFLQGETIEIVEVSCPNRQLRRSHGKSDPVDAVAAARAALSGSADTEPKSRDGKVEAIRALRTADRSARHARVKALNQMRALLLTGPDELREQFRGSTVWQLAHSAARLRPGDPTTAVGGTKYALRLLARRVLELEAELAELKAILKPLVAATAPRSWPVTDLAPTQPVPFWLPPATIPSVCAMREPSPTSVVWPRSTPHRAPSSASVSIETATVRQTRPYGAS